MKHMLRERHTMAKFTQSPLKVAPKRWCADTRANRHEHEPGDASVQSSSERGVRYGGVLMAKSIKIDRSKRLRDEPHTGHNRWHPDIPPVIEVDPFEEVVLETRESSDGQIRPGTTAADLLKMDSKVVHPLTGPVYVKGAKPGDLLEIEYLKIVHQRHGWTRFVPGIGFLH